MVAVVVLPAERVDLAAVAVVVAVVAFAVAEFVVAVVVAFARLVDLWGHRRRYARLVAVAVAISFEADRAAVVPQHSSVAAVVVVDWDWPCASEAFVVGDARIVYWEITHS